MRSTTFTCASGRFCCVPITPPGSGSLGLVRMWRMTRMSKADDAIVLQRQRRESLLTDLPKRNGRLSNFTQQRRAGFRANQPAAFRQQREIPAEMVAVRQ